MIKSVTKYYCDRCGEEVAVSPAICCNTNPETAIRIQRSEWIWADLCDKCKESFKAWWEKSSASPTGEEVKKNDKEEVERIVKNLPEFVERQMPKMGKLIKDNNGVHCSLCNKEWAFIHGVPIEVFEYNYCPSCGAKMDVPDNNVGEMDCVSRQAVQTELKNCEVVDVCDENDNFIGYYNADTVDSIVRNLPPVIPEPCDDCISRNLALEKMADYVASGYADSAEDFEEYSKIICQLPPVKPEQKRRKQILNAVKFAEWVAEEIFDDNWEYNKDAFAELACRKLEKLGIVRAKGDEWELVKPQERSDKK